MTSEPLKTPIADATQFIMKDANQICMKYKNEINLSEFSCAFVSSVVQYQWLKVT